MIRKFFSVTLKILLLFFMTSVTTEVTAQANIQAGYTVYTLKAPGFDTFFKTYNEYFSKTLKTPFKTSFPSASGWTWKVGYKLPYSDDGGLYYNSSTGVNRLVTNNEVEFTNSEKRKIRLLCRDWTTDVALGAGGKFVYVAATGSVTLRFNKLYSSYVFTNGTESFGAEHNMNGVFGAQRIMGGYGLEIGAGTELIKVVGKIHKIYKPFEKDGSTYLNYYLDLTPYKGGGGLANSWPTEYFPADVKYFTDNQMDSESNNNFVYINDYGWEFSIAIQVMLDFNKD